MGLTKKDKSDIAEIVGVTIVQYHDLNVKPEFDKIHQTLAKHTEMLNKHSEMLNNHNEILTKHGDALARLESDVSDVNRKLTDLSIDTPNRKEFNQHSQKIQRLEHELGFA